MQKEIQLVEQLRSFFKGVEGIHLCTSMEDFLQCESGSAQNEIEKETRKVFVGEGTEEWTLFRTFPIRANGFLWDPKLGTMGFVHFLSWDTPNPDDRKEVSVEDSLEERISGMLRRWLENAAYARHLQYEEMPDGACPMQVEVVIVVCNEHPTSPDVENKGVVEVVADTLRSLSEESTFLHTIGVNLLDASKAADEAEMRRAFPFLLSATWKWMRQRTNGFRSNSAVEREDPRVLRSLYLENYRVAGRRELNLESSPRLHVIHGPNGSGKSSLVEAIELMVRGRAQRISGDRSQSSEESETIDYRNVITHRHSHSNGDSPRPLVLKAELTHPEKPSSRASVKKWKAEIGENGCENPLDGGMGLPAGAFRLDQQLSNRLLFGSKADRAGIFLNDLFSSEGKEIDRYHSSLRQERAAWESFPESIRKRYDVPREVPRGRSITGLPMVYLDGLRLSQSRETENTIEVLLNHLLDGSVSASERIDEAWVILMKSRTKLLRDLELAKSLLERLEHWRPSKRRGAGSISDGRHFVEVYNDWLSRVALCDLLKKDEQITAALVKAQSLGWEQPNDKNWFRRINERTEKRLSEIRAELKLLSKERDELQVKLNNFRDEKDHPSDVSKALVVTEDEVSALNSVQFLIQLQGEGEEDLGVAIRRAVNSGDEVELVRLGSRKSSAGTKVRHFVGHLKGGLREIIEPMEDYISILRYLSENGDEFLRSPSEISDLVCRLRDATTESEESGKTVIEKFQRQVQGELKDALNEMMALMTPARWAYEEIELEQRFDEDGRHVEMRSGDLDAEVKLNTAELNTLTLSLFLLTAVGRPDNPISTVILDDPFENMDELTTVTVGRAIGRFMRLWNDDDDLKNWQMMVFLHGAENVERVRDEVPCAAYFLPWLVPLMGATQDLSGEIAPSVSRMRADLHVDPFKSSLE